MFWCDIWNVRNSLIQKHPLGHAGKVSALHEIARDLLVRIISRWFWRPPPRGGSENSWRKKVEQEISKFYALARAKLTGVVGERCEKMF